MRHALGVLGVLAAGVLLAVSAAMNWRFGLSLGRTELDGQIYGAASAAADCLKALIPFFLFAAIKNKMWSQAVASAVVWVVVTSYSLTSAFGHAALNRQSTSGERQVAAQAYKDLRADLQRAQEQLSWVPQHRPAATVQSEMDSVKNDRAWKWTDGCTKTKGKYQRTVCDKYHALAAELGSAEQRSVLEARIAETQSKLATTSGGSVMADADPQAAVLAKIAGIDVDKVQMALTAFIAILLEIGSGFGMYVAFSTWRIDDRLAPAAPKMARLRERETSRIKTAQAVVAEPVVEAIAAPRIEEQVSSEIADEMPSDLDTAAAAVAEVAAPAAAPVAIEPPRSGANDNKSAPAAQPQRLVAPETDVERFYKERIDTQDGSSLTATTLYEDYCAWCEELNKEPLALPTFGREFGDLGVQKAKIAGRVRYIGIALRSEQGQTEDKNSPAFSSEAA
ncbi:MAG: hypothetical protein KDJ47_06745 [Hyphomicrobiaceae bacterium]|nr:hypothetical protein [Hyphomicrobiaceae bacterium]